MTKKVMLFIVEGPTDAQALGPILKRLFRTEKLRFHIVHGDMTAAIGMCAENAIATVRKHIQQEMQRYGFTRADVMRVVHLVDTDGAFVPDDCVLFENVQQIAYAHDCILSQHPQKITERNARKSAVLHRLYTTTTIDSMPYAVYYFSRNLEHVLHDVDAHLPDDKKVGYADAFADLFIDNPRAFENFIASATFAVNGTYLQTWQFIQHSTRSLHRHCNLHLLFQDG